jgi:hypothetical protein
MSDDQEGRTFLPLRQFIFFHRAMLISTDAQFSIHTDVKMEAETFAGYMQLTVCVMHKHFPDNVIQETFVWDITRPDRSMWAIPQEKLEKVCGEKYEMLIHRKKVRAQDWYMARVAKIELLINHLVMQMFIDGCVTVDKIEMLIQEKYRPQGGAEMIARLPWDDKDSYQI